MRIWVRSGASSVVSCRWFVSLFLTKYIQKSHQSFKLETLIPVLHQNSAINTQIRKTPPLLQTLRFQKAIPIIVIICHSPRMRRPRIHNADTRATVMRAHVRVARAGVDAVLEGVNPDGEQVRVGEGGVAVKVVTGGVDGCEGRGE